MFDGRKVAVPSPHLPELPDRDTRDAVIFLMRLANAGPFTGREFLSPSLIEIARQLNSVLPENDRVLIHRDPLCIAGFAGADADELIRAACIAIGAYTETEGAAQLRKSRTGGYLMLERYFAHCLAMWEEAERHGKLSDSEQQSPSKVLALDVEIYKAGAFIGHWLASLCPVIEGWEELKLRHPEIDLLLEEGTREDFRNRLFRFRNGVIHFQRDSDDAKFADFMDEAGEARLWASRLEVAFEHFFRFHGERDYSQLLGWLTR